MLTIKNVKTLQGKTQDITVKSEKDQVIDGKNLTLLPALIDCHVHFRTPGAEHKENWITGAKAAISGGITTVFDMPNTNPPTVDLKSFEEKKKIIDGQLKEVGIPLHYSLWLGADKNHLTNFGGVKRLAVGLKIYMGSSTGGLVMNAREDLERAFQLAAQENMMVAVHAEDEKLMQERRELFKGETNPSYHSKIRDRTVAIQATKEAISLAEKHGTQLFILHVSTKEELDLIREAKKRQLLIYAETTPHHLFLNENDYAKWGTKVQVNPPLRTKEDQEALWRAIHDGTIDTIGSDHAPHTLEEKGQPFGKAPSGIPSVELTLPLLLNAVHEKKLNLETLIKLMRINPEQMFNLQRNKDVVLVDLELEKEVRDENLKTKCGWSPYQGKTLKGWPIYTILNGVCYECQ